jgi:putative transcriptional regulator
MLSREYALQRILLRLRDWEQGRVEPDQAARDYLKVIAREPEIVREALKPVAAGV